MNNHKYRKLTNDDLIKISEKRNNFINCNGKIYQLTNTKQAIIITYCEIAQRLKPKLEKRKALIIAEITKNNKTYLLLNCENLASIKALCKTKDIKAPKKIKAQLRLNDILIN